MKQRLVVFGLRANYNANSFNHSIVCWSQKYKATDAARVLNETVTTEAVKRHNTLRLQLNAYNRLRQKHGMQNAFIAWSRTKKNKLVWLNAVQLKLRVKAD